MAFHYDINNTSAVQLLDADTHTIVPAPNVGDADDTEWTTLRLMLRIHSLGV
jgi:hypothetical protein